MSHPMQPLVPGLDAMEGLLVAKGAAGKVKVLPGIAMIAGQALIEQSVEDAEDAAKELDIAALAVGNHLVFANHPDAKDSAGVALPKFTVGEKEEYVPVVNPINNTPGQMVGRSRVLAEVTVALEAGDKVVAAISNKARYELKNFEGHFTQMMPGGLRVDNNNLDKA